MAALGLSAGRAEGPVLILLEDFVSEADLAVSGHKPIKETNAFHGYATPYRLAPVRDAATSCLCSRPTAKSTAFACLGPQEVAEAR